MRRSWLTGSGQKYRTWQARYQVGWYVADRLFDVASDQGQAAASNGQCVAAPRALQNDGRPVDADDGGGRIGGQQFP